MRMLTARAPLAVLGLMVMTMPATAEAQTFPPPEPRRQFVSVGYGGLYTHPLHFAEHPLEDLVGKPVASAQRREFDYETRDGGTRITVNEFKRRAAAAAVTVYPFGLRSGAALGVRGSLEGLPAIRLSFDGPDRLDSYELADARAFDAGLGIFVADRSPGWGLGSQAFVVGGVGRITSSLGDGSRYFAEAGGGLQSGPLGVELSVKFAWNRLSAPVAHRFLTVPVTLRATMSF